MATSVNSDSKCSKCHELGGVIPPIYLNIGGEDGMTKSSENFAPEALRGIRGIGPARQKWLGETLNIVTIDDLAMASWESIAFEVSQDDGIIIPRHEIQSWITQAQAERPQANLAIVDADLAPELSDQNVLEIADEAIPDEPLALAPIAIVIPDLILAILQVQIIQSNSNPIPILPGQSNIPILWTHQPFEVEVQFELEIDAELDEPMEEAIVSATYHVQCHVQNRVTQWMTILESPISTALIPEKTIYNSRLPSFQLPLGIYRLQIWVTLTGIRSVGYFDIPLIQIT